MIAAGLTPEDAAAAWEAAAGARNRKAAFVWACKKGLGLETGKAAKSVPMTAEVQSFAARLEQARRNKGGTP